jgi:DNA invertase Pin-like site-specific DNA recombinase
MEKFVAYYRVSTRKQGISGLGLEGQRNRVEEFVSNRGGVIIGAFQEVESGKRPNRPELVKAIALCKDLGTTLIVSEVDRLTRAANFVDTLRDSGIEFIATDMPFANRQNIDVVALLAQHQWEKISSATKAALKVKIARGWKPGNAQNFSNEDRRKGAEAVRAAAMENENNRKAALYAKSLQDAGNTLKQICQKLEEGGFKTATGGKFHPTSIHRILKRYEKANNATL